MPSSNTIDCRCLTILYQPSDAETAERLNRLLETHLDARTYTRSRTPDSVVVATDSGAVTIPAVVFPTERPGDVEIDLFGAGEVLSFSFPHTPTTTAILTPSGWAAYRRELLERNQFLALRLKPRSAVASPVARCPSALASVVSAFHPVGRSMEARIASVTEKFEVVTVPVRSPGLRAHTERIVTVDLTVNGQDARALHVPLTETVAAVSGPQHELGALCWERMAASLDTRTLKTALALIHVASTQQSRVIGINVSEDDPDVPALAARVSWAELGRQQGWDRLNKQDRRDQLGEDIDLLQAIRFTFDVQKAGGRRLSNVPLFYRAGNVKQGPNGHAVLLGVNEVLWKSMVEDQRAIIYDPAILTTTDKQDWHFRIYFYVVSRLSRSWITQSLGDDGGRLTLRLGTLLDGAGLDYQHQLHAKGPAWLRDKLRTVLEQLKARQWDRRGLFAKYSYKTFPDDVLQDAVTIWPPVAIIEALTQHRPKSLAARRRGLFNWPQRPEERHDEPPIAGTLSHLR